MATRLAATRGEEQKRCAAPLVRPPPSSSCVKLGVKLASLPARSIELVKLLYPVQDGLFARLLHLAREEEFV